MDTRGRFSDDDADGRVTGELPRVSATSQMPIVSDTPPEFSVPDLYQTAPVRPFLWEGRWWSRTPRGLFWYDVVTQQWVAYAPPAYLPDRDHGGGQTHGRGARETASPLRRGRRRPRLTAVIGGPGVVVGTLLPWVSSAAGSFNAFDIPVEALLSADFGAGGAPVGVALVVLGILAALLAFVPFMGFVRALCGLLVVAAAAAFAGQLFRVVGTHGGFDALVGALEAGFYTTAVAGVVLTLGR